MQTTFKETIQKFMLENIDFLVQKFNEEICSDPESVEGQYVQLIYNSLDIENLNIENFHYMLDTLGERKFVSLFEIKTDDIKCNYDEMIEKQSSTDIDDELETELYHQAIRTVLRIEIDYIWLD